MTSIENKREIEELTKRVEGSQEGMSFKVEPKHFSADITMSGFDDTIKFDKF